MRRTLVALVAGAAILGGLPAAAQNREVVEVAAGTDAATIKSRITGHDYRDYLLKAEGGEELAVSIVGGSNITPYFNILPPGSDAEALYNSSIDGNDVSAFTLDAEGEYTIRVYLMGNAADTRKTVPFTLTVHLM
jgi:hypothetical protein